MIEVYLFYFILVSQIPISGTQIQMLNIQFSLKNIELRSIRGTQQKIFPLVWYKFMLITLGYNFDIKLTLHIHTYIIHTSTIT